MNQAEKQDRLTAIQRSLEPLPDELRRVSKATLPDTAERAHVKAALGLLNPHRKGDIGANGDSRQQDMQEFDGHKKSRHRCNLSIGNLCRGAVCGQQREDAVRQSASAAVRAAVASLRRPWC